MRQPKPDLPLEIHSVKASPAGKEQVIVRVSVKGRWRRRETPGRALLVLQADGRRHRFPAVPEARRAMPGRPGSWSASFALPAWLAPRLADDAVLWVDNTAIPVPPPAGELEELAPPEASPQAEAWSQPEASSRPEAFSQPDRPKRLAPVELADRIRREVEPVARSNSDGVSGARSNAQPDDHPRAGSLAELRAELEQRAASEARLRGELAELRAELDERNDGQERIERTHAQLRSELQQLRNVVASMSDLAAERDRLTDELKDLKAEVAATTVSRDAARREAKELRAQLERIASHRAGGVAERTQVQETAIGEAEALLAEARALRTRIAETPSPVKIRTSSNV